MNIWISLILSLAVSSLANALPADKSFSDLLGNAPKSSLEKRIDYFSRQLLDKPYQLGPLGEGKTGKFDQHPLYTDNAFDCLTYVETVLALSFSHDLPQFKRLMDKLRYRHAKIAYLKRNHFASVDWNKNNEAAGFVNDITYQFTNQSGIPIAKTAEAIIDKPGWYRSKSVADIQRPNIDSNTQKLLLEDLQALANQTRAEKAVLSYLPLQAFFQDDDAANQHILEQFPTVSIVEIVRPNWELKSKIGTNLLISHLGFAIQTPKGLIFRHASAVSKKTVELPLTDYLKKYLKNGIIGGIAVLRINPRGV